MPPSPPLSVLFLSVLVFLITSTYFFSDSRRMLFTSVRYVGQFSFATIHGGCVNPSVHATSQPGHILATLSLYVSDSTSPPSSTPTSPWSCRAEWSRSVLLALISKASISGDRFWRIGVYNLIASQPRKPNLRNIGWKLTQPITSDRSLTHITCHCPKTDRAHIDGKLKWCCPGAI